LDAAVPLLEKVARENPKHDYGHTLMGYAEALGKSGRREQALAAWQQVLEDHSYARARVQVSEFYIQMGEKERAKKELTELLADESHAAAFQKKQDRIWVKQAKTLLKEIG
jgi:hypothetical protein